MKMVCSRWRDDEDNDNGFCGGDSDSDDADYDVDDNNDDDKKEDKLIRISGWWTDERYLKVHKIENFFDSVFGICVISLLVMSKY